MSTPERPHSQNRVNDQLRAVRLDHQRGLPSAEHVGQICALRNEDERRTQSGVHATDGEAASPQLPRALTPWPGGSDEEGSLKKGWKASRLLLPTQQAGHPRPWQLCQLGHQDLIEDLGNRQVAQTPTAFMRTEAAF